ncbi:MAG: helix-turn-helix transcriptional regulator [bacterium]|nr:helix-turn-helix transcriptional regulator [bacterium]
MSDKKLSTNPLIVLLELVGAKWKLLIIKELLIKEMRFVELKKKLGCTAKVLTACLREMETDGLIVREEYEGQPVKIEYYLTDIGYTLKPVLDSMTKWGKEYKRLRKLMEKYNNETNIPWS